VPVTITLVSSDDMNAAVLWGRLQSTWQSQLHGLPRCSLS